MGEFCLFDTNEYVVYTITVIQSYAQYFYIEE